MLNYSGAVRGFKLNYLEDINLISIIIGRKLLSNCYLWHNISCDKEGHISAIELLCKPVLRSSSHILQVFIRILQRKLYA